MSELNDLESKYERQGALLGMRATEQPDQFEPVPISFEQLPDGATRLSIGPDVILLKETKLLAHLRAAGLG